MSEFGVLLRESGLLDEEWYFKRYPDVRMAGLSALEHQVMIGALEGRDPGPGFEAALYAGFNSDFPTDRSISPLEHYLRYGRAAGVPGSRKQQIAESEFGALLRKSGLLDADWYLDRYPDVGIGGFTAFEHLVLIGAMEGRDPGPGFEAALYIQHSPNFPTDHSISPLEHYLRFGRDAGIPGSRRDTFEMSEFGVLLRESGLLDEEWYFKRYPDVRMAGLSALEHQVMIGALEGRDPGPGFEAALYIEQSLNLPTDRSISPLEHYLRFGKAKGCYALERPPYERWVRQFDTLTAKDRHRIETDAQARSMPPVTCFHIQSVQDGPAEAIAEALNAQIGFPAARSFIVDQDALGDAVRTAEGLQEGSLVILTGGGVILRPQAFYAFVSALMADDTVAVYSDHDHEDAEGRRTRPVFKPAMSPEFMRHHSYAGPAVAIRLTREMRSRVPKLLQGALEGDPATVFAAMLLDIDRKHVTRVPLCLYSLPRSRGETDADLDFVYEFVPGNEKDRSIACTMDLPQVRIIIPTRDRYELLESCISSILEKTDYPLDRYHIIVVDNASSEPKSLEYLQKVRRNPSCSVTPSPGPFNFSKICNNGAASTDGEVLVFLNNDMTVIEADWLTTLVSYANEPDVGIVGAKLLYPNDTVQHGGVVLGVQGVGAHRYGGYAASDSTHLDATREMTAITGACIAMRRMVFEALGGFDPNLAVAFNDVRLCIRTFESGYRNIYVARPLLYHHESISRGFDDTREKKAIALREAIYVRSLHGALFRDDPSYSPNLSLQRIGDLAVPPRYLVPWRRSATYRHVLILSLVHGIGHGVAHVVALQAEQFLSRGWQVTIGGPRSERDREYPGCTRVRLVTERQAAAYAIEHGCDCIIAHTSPFFSLARYLGHRPLFYFFDHGEPPPELFDNQELREAQIWEKRFCAPLAHRVFVISQTIYDEQYRRDAQILRNGNTHLSTWSAQWNEARVNLRKKLGFEGRFVIFNVCRFHEAERRYKGVDLYATLAAEIPYMVPALSDRTTFVLAGRGDEEDVSYLRKLGIVVFPNITNEEMAELYAASDLYISLSQWEGYNLGIAQALAMGLPVVASDIPAHREFGVPTANTIPKLCALVAEAFVNWDDTLPDRTARLEPWDTSLSRLVDIVEKDVAADRAGPWL
jgi:GT2 family glycosyltransferase